MKQWIREQNIKHFRGVLQRDLAPEQRVIVEGLLEDELAGYACDSGPTEVKSAPDRASRFFGA